MAKVKLSDAATFERIDVSANKLNSGRWRIMVVASPFLLQTTLYDIKVQMVTKGAGNKSWPVQLSSREMFACLENRYALLDNLGTEAVVCFTAHDPSSPKRLRMAKYFSIEADQEPGLIGYSAAFVPSREPSLAPPSDVPCE